MQSASSPPPQPPEHLGKGTYGTVSRGTDPKTGKPVAVKHIKADVFSHNNVDEKRIYREIKLLQMLEGHPNIVAVKYLTTSATSPENLKGVDIGLEEYKINLSELYRIKQTRPITELDVQNLFYQLLCGINFIHSARVVHRDLKSANILIKNEEQGTVLAIADFGLARALQPLDAYTPKLTSAVSSSSSSSTSPAPPRFTRQLTAHVVTRWYRAPEVCLHENYSYPIDMWSLGCILAELLHWQQGKNPICALFPGDPGHQLTAIFDIIGTPSKEDIDAVSHHSKYQDYLRKLPAKKRQDWNTLFPKASPSAIDLLDRLLTFNPNKRITAPEALAHEFLKPFHNDPVRHYTFPIAQKTMRASALQKEDEESLLQYYLAEIQVDDRSGNTKDKKVQTELHQLIFQETQKYTLNNTKRDQQQLSGVSNICASAAKAIIAAAPSPSPAAQKGTPSSFAVAIATSTPHLQAPPPVPGIAFFFADVIAKTVPQPKQPVYTPRR